MPEDYMARSQKFYMTADEIVGIAAVFKNLGVKKIRLTGGEPLVRKDAAKIIQNLATTLGPEVQLTLTTNGILADKFLPTFLDSGVTSLNISLDTMMPEQFEVITRRNYFHQVVSNIHLMLQHGIRIKLNVVMMKGVNDNELLDFVQWTRDYPLHVRFIEFMPFDGNEWKKDKLITKESMLGLIKHHYEVMPLENQKNDTDSKFKVIGHEGTFAFINTMSEPFCSGCNRIRLTADGKIKNCLFSQGELDLLTPFREGKDIAQIIQQNIAAKFERWGGQELFKPTENRSMIAIGG
jgi:GTP 3',8-cyclase